MKIAKQGYRFVISGIAIAAVGFIPMLGFMGWLWIVVGLGFAGFSVYFFRDPERTLPSDPDTIYAPGDGKVLSVAQEDSSGAVTVRIFLSIFDVHIQRNPVSGVVADVQYLPGSFKMAMADEARHNERNIVRILPESGRPIIAVEQIAGFIARRIQCWIKKGVRVKAGARYGIIYFGSQVAVHLPPGARAIVVPGDRVTAGITGIGTWTKAS